MRWHLAAGARLMGVAAKTLQDRLARNLDYHAEALLIAAVGMWQHHGWHRFDNDEVNCTVQMYRWSQECIRRDSRFTLISMHLEWIDVTREILLGEQSATTAKRPDLRIKVDDVGRTIECKRIAATGSWARKYVHEGLARFVTGSYGHAETTGFMIGYALSSHLPNLVNRINTCIQGHSNMGHGQQITLKSHSPPTLVGVSRHSRSSSQPSQSPIDITHLLIALGP